MVRPTRPCSRRSGSPRAASGVQGRVRSKAKWGFLPEAHTDFILAVVGEELGLIGTIAIIAAVAAVVGAAIVIGIRCRDFFGSMVAFGIATWFGVQAVINVGVAVGACRPRAFRCRSCPTVAPRWSCPSSSVGVLLAISRTAGTPSRAKR